MRKVARARDRTLRLAAIGQPKSRQTDIWEEQDEEETFLDFGVDDGILSDRCRVRPHGAGGDQRACRNQRTRCNQCARGNQRAGRN